MLIPTLILVTLLVFFMVRFIPGDIIDVMIAEQQAYGGSSSVVDREALMEKLGLDVPVYVQYFRWIGGIFQGDLGESLWKAQPVLDVVLSRLPISLELGLIAIFIGTIFAIPIGILSAIRQDAAPDYVGRVVAILFLCLCTVASVQCVVQSNAGNLHSLLVDSADVALLQQCGLWAFAVCVVLVLTV